MIILLQLNGFQGFLRKVNSERRQTNTQCSMRFNQLFHWDFIRNPFTRSTCTTPNQIDITLFHRGRSGPHIIPIHCDNCLGMQSILTAHYCFRAKIITMKNIAEYWLQVGVFFFLLLLLHIHHLLFPLMLYTVIFFQKSDRWLDVWSSEKKKKENKHLYCRQVGVYHLRDGVSSALKGE